MEIHSNKHAYKLTGCKASKPLIVPELRKDIYSEEKMGRQRLFSRQMVFRQPKLLLGYNPEGTLGYYTGTVD